MAWAPDYAEASDLTAYTRIPDESDDAQIALALSTSSRAVDRYCGRQFGLVAAPEVRYYKALFDRNRRKWTVQIDDLMTTTGLLLDGEPVVSPVLLPRNAAAKGRPWTELVLDTEPADVDEVAVTARWGWTTVPVSVKYATLQQAARFLKRRDAPFGVAGSPDAGSEIRLLAKVDPDVAVALNPFVRWWGAA